MSEGGPDSDKLEPTIAEDKACLRQGLESYIDRKTPYQCQTVAQVWEGLSADLENIENKVALSDQRVNTLLSRFQAILLFISYTEEIMDACDRLERDIRAYLEAHVFTSGLGQKVPKAPPGVNRKLYYLPASIFRKHKHRRDAKDTPLDLTATPKQTANDQDRYRFEREGGD